MPNIILPSGPFGFQPYGVVPRKIHSNASYYFSLSSVSSNTTAGLYVLTDLLGNHPICVTAVTTVRIWPLGRTSALWKKHRRPHEDTTVFTKPAVSIYVVFLFDSSVRPRRIGVVCHCCRAIVTPEKGEKTFLMFFFSTVR